MILSSCYQVKLKKTIRKILYLHAAYSQTFVFLCMIVDRKDAIVHVDKEGKILFQHIFQKPMQTMAMLSDKEVILIETRQNRISVLDLTTHTFRYFPFQFMFEESDQSQLLTFPQTRYLCLVERGKYNVHRFRLTYFTYPLQLNQNKAVKHYLMYQSKQDEWTYEHKTVQANNFSMVLWFKIKHDDAFQFKTYDIQEGKGQFRLYRFSHSIAANKNQSKVETAITNVWEIKPKNFIFVCWTAKTTHQQGKSINSNYIIDIEKSGAIRQANFSFGPYQDYLIDCYNLGAYSMFRTFKVENKKALPTPTYYIDNETETLKAEEVWTCTSQVKYQFEGYSSGTLCEGFYQNLDVSKFTVKVKRIFNKNDLFTFFMQEWIGSQLDNDLIDDVTRILS